MLVTKLGFTVGLILRPFEGALVVDGRDDGVLDGAIEGVAEDGAIDGVTVGTTATSALSFAQ